MSKEEDDYWRHVRLKESMMHDGELLGPDDGIHDPGDYPPAPTGLVLTGDVAALQREMGAARREVRVLRRLNAVLQEENTRLRALLAASTLPHAVGCLTIVNPAYPCSCAAGPHNARIAAALHESLDESSAPPESPGAATDH